MKLPLSSILTSVFIHLRYYCLPMLSQYCKEPSHIHHLISYPRYPDVGISSTAHITDRRLGVKDTCKITGQNAGQSESNFQLIFRSCSPSCFCERREISLHWAGLINLCLMNDDKCHTLSPTLKLSPLTGQTYTTRHPKISQGNIFSPRIIFTLELKANDNFFLFPNHFETFRLK